MSLIETALAIALRAYGGKRDKAGRDYILHPLRLMAKMQTEEEMATALLHDVIEDSNITADELLAAGIPAEVLEAVICLTRHQDESYETFILRARGNPIARKVKLADIEDNINVLRLPALNEADLERVRKYHAAWQVLREE